MVMTEKTSCPSRYCKLFDAFSSNNQEFFIKTKGIQNKNGRARAGLKKDDLLMGDHND